MSLPISFKRAWKAGSGQSVLDWTPSSMILEKKTKRKYTFLKPSLSIIMTTKGLLAPPSNKKQVQISWNHLGSNSTAGQILVTSKSYLEVVMKVKERPQRQYSLIARLLHTLRLSRINWSLNYSRLNHQKEACHKRAMASASSTSSKRKKKKKKFQIVALQQKIILSSIQTL